MVDSGAPVGSPHQEHEEDGPILLEGIIDPGREIYVRVAEALPYDIDRGIARMDELSFAALNLMPGSLIHVTGQRSTTMRAELAPLDPSGRHVIRMDGTLRDNLNVGIDDRVRVVIGGGAEALSIVISSADNNPLTDDDVPLLRAFLSGWVLTPGDKVRVTSLTRGDSIVEVQETEPNGPVVVRPDTVVILRTPLSQKVPAHLRAPVRYEDIGGLEQELQRVRELIELPMKYPQLFAKLRIEPPKGVLLYGPPGTGKTLIARAVATEVDATFIHVNGPEIMQKYVGESEARLREVFEQAQREAPAIIFLDEIDAIAPKRLDVVGEVEKRVVAQLLTLMDGLMARGQVTVIGATNLPQLVDPALRRPGRFDREVPVNPPTKFGRRQIMSIHTRGLPLADDVDLDRLSEITHGFVGADLEVLSKEAGMLALREVLDRASLDTVDPIAVGATAQIHDRHFLSALKGIEPSATREVIVEKPNVPWDHVGGLDAVRATLETAIELPRQYPHLFQQAGIRPPRGILFSGPSGSGKSLMARAIATATGLSLITADAATLLSKWLGESEKSVRQVFARARQASPCILFFDDLDAIAPARGSDSTSGAIDRVVSQILSELDGLEEHSEVIVLGATNRLDLVDPALLSPKRFGTVIEFNLPDEEGRVAILGAHTAKMPLAGDVDLLELAMQSEGFSGADLAAVCQRAAMQAIRRVVEHELAHGGPPDEGLKVHHARFAEAMAEVRKHLLNVPVRDIVRLTPHAGQPGRPARPEAR
jgi:transitional endoplasmic reticulum ATPase